MGFGSDRIDGGWVSDGGGGVDRSVYGWATVCYESSLRAELSALRAVAASCPSRVPRKGTRIHQVRVKTVTHPCNSPDFGGLELGPHQIWYQNLSPNAS